MKLEDIVCDFEYAEKLHEFGLRSNGLFWFCNDKRSITRNGNSQGAFISTYTVAELGEMIPDKITIENIGAINDLAHIAYYRDIVCERHSCYVMHYQGVFNNPHLAQRQWFHDKKEANARVMLLIWLIENNHVKVEELNK